MRYGIHRTDTLSDHKVMTDYVDTFALKGLLGVAFLKPVIPQCNAVNRREGIQSASIRFNDINKAAWFCNWCNMEYASGWPGIRYEVMECND